MNRQDIFKHIKSKKSFLCVGLDTDPLRIPQHLNKLEDPVFEFNKRIIDATHSYAIAYKPNLAFYEAQGAKGWESLQKTIDYIPKECFTIADAKRADIGNTSNLYARAFFENMDVDAITISPYMGKDSVEPFLKYKGKWAILLAATSNPGHFDFQDLMTEKDSEKLYEVVLKKSRDWGTSNNMMYVVGATRVESLITVRTMVPEHFLLIPGVGAQGGSLEQVCKYGMNKECGLLVNSSRGIIYAGDGEDFDKKAADEARKIQSEMETHLQKLL